jgi:creatinine amidohydrolase
MSTKIYLYEVMTFPELTAIPREIPLILPLGVGYDFDQLANQLGNPAQILVLPPFPFGWNGSAIEVSRPILQTYIGNLLAGLREDGFTRLYVLCPRDFGLSLDGIQVLISDNDITLEPAQFPSDSDLEKVIVLPIGHTEQHSYHLPMATDTLIIDAIASGMVAQAGQFAARLPVMPYGVSTHRASFFGTLNAGGRAFEDFWLEVIDCLVKRGFNRFYFINGHGGNGSFLVNVIKYAGESHRRIFCATAFLYLSGSTGIAALEKYRDSQIGGLGHACELETSFILHLRPELVHMDRVRDDTWVEGGALVANPPWDDDSIYGAYGAGTFGTARKGEIWLAAAIEEKIAHVMEIHEQHTRREERRNAGYGLWGSSIRIP